MQKGKVDLAKYQDAIRLLSDNSSYKYCGYQGYCFIEGRRVIKIYNNPIDIGNITDLSKYYSNRIAFPKAYIENDGKVYGEIMPYCNGKTLSEAFSTKSSTELLKEHYEEMLKEIEFFSNLVMLDMDFSENILYSQQKGFYLIDTTSWMEKNGDENKDNFSNQDLFTSVLLIYLYQVIFDTSSTTHIYQEIKNRYQGLKTNNIGKEFLSVLKANLYCDFHLLELMIAWEEIIKNYYNYQVSSLGDVKKYTKIMKNS